MSNQFVQREGVALVDISIRASSADTDALPLLGNSVILSRVEYTETCDGISNATFVISTATRDYVDKLLKENQAGEHPLVRWRIGIGTRGGEADWIPWQDHILRSSSSALEGLGESTGYLTILKTSDLLWEIDLINRTVARKGKISGIVQSIADAYKLPSVIEPTKTEGLYYQSFISDFQFVQQRMVPRAINAKNRGNYQFYLRDGTLHFHTIDYQADLKQFVYYGTPGSKISFHDHSQERIDLGAAGVRVVAHDPYTGKFGAVVSKPENTLRLSNTAPESSKLAGAERNIMVTLGENRSIDATSVASNVYESAKAGIYTLSLIVPKTVFFRANDLCQVIIQPDNKQVPPASGLYQVFNVAHNVDKTSIVTEVTMRRGEYFTKDKLHNELHKSGQPAIQPGRAAEGQSPNLKSVASSAITKGTGKQMSTTVVVDTLNPNLPAP